MRIWSAIVYIFMRFMRFFSHRDIANSPLGIFVPYCNQNQIWMCLFLYMRRRDNNRKNKDFIGNIFG